jgi:hypothetical protein
MKTLRKVLTIVGLGLMIWSLGLVWPELDFAVILAVVGAVVVMLGSIGLALYWRDHINEHHPHNGSSRPSRPVMVH